MAELHSIAYSLLTHNNNNNNFHTSSLDLDLDLDWSLQNIETIDQGMSIGNDGPLSPFLSPLGSDVSTGYLEDALLECNERSKRRRFLSNNSQTKEFNENYWDTSCNWDLSENFSCISHTTNFDGVSLSDEARSRNISFEEETMNVKDILQTPDIEAVSELYEVLDSSSSSYKDSHKIVRSLLFDRQPNMSSTPVCSSGNNVDKKKKKRDMSRVVYPFALVKPGGTEDDVTINDINERISMPPTRPVRHPVGEYAYRSSCSATGRGPSGKDVVALTRIQTHGRGTITIIRTKG